MRSAGCREGPSVARLAGSLAALAVLSVLLSAPAAGRVGRPSQSPLSAVTFVVSGHGWGHGVGLAQYGALGYANHGSTYDRILAHYYPGTELGAAPVSRVRVLIAEQRAKVTISSSAPFRARSASGAIGPADPRPVTVSAAQAIAPLTFLPGAAPLELNGRPYRGLLEVDPAGKGLQVIDVVGIDQYLYGVVTSEMPSDWPAQALQAQAVAARSYALANRHGGGFDLYADVRSQVYGGVDAETPAARAAVDATAKKVLFYGGKVADTFFFASSGGRTADATEVFSPKPIPYLVSVDDPYDTLSPYHDWGPVVLTAEHAGRLLQVEGLQDLTSDPGPSGRARTVTATGVLGQTSFDGTTFRRVFGLRSAWVAIGVLALDRPKAPLQYGAQTRLTGHVRGLKGIVLEQRLPGSIWQVGARLAPGSDGSFAASTKPRQTTEYRLRNGTSTGQPARLAVVPLIQAVATADGTGIGGLVRPLVPGALVAVQQLTATWKTVASAGPDPSGSFSFQLAPGDYRVRYAPGHGLSAGSSATVHVGG